MSKYFQAAKFLPVIKGLFLYYAITGFACVLIVYSGMKIPGYKIPAAILPAFGTTWPAYILAGAILILVIPIAEELLFRQLFLKKLLEKLSEKNSSIIVAFFFALANLFYSSFTPALIFGLILNWLFISTKSVKQCITLHVIKNIIVCTLQLLLVKGVIPLDF